MRFSTYRQLREEEEQKQDTGTGVLAEAAPKQAGKRKFTDVMKEREPERYVRMTAERKYRSVSGFDNKVRQQIGYNDMQAADAMSYINKHKDNYTLDADDNAVRRKAVYDQEKENILALMQEAHSNTDLDTQHRQQALNALAQSLANINSADKMNEGFSDYMKQFANKEAFERTREAERKLEEAQTLTPDELRTKISETEKLLEQADSEYKKLSKMRAADVLMNNKIRVGPIIQTLGLYKNFGVTAEELNNAEYQKTTLENDIQNYKNIIFEKEQQETLDSLSDSAMEALEYYRQVDEYGWAYTHGLSMHHKSAIEGLSDFLTKKPAIKESVAELLDGKDFDSVYEYYKFAKDKEDADKSKKTTEKLYNDLNAAEKFGMNTMTVMSTPTRGISAAKELVKSQFYNNEYAPLNINSENYSMTNYTDDVRNATSQDIDNDILRFLYQNGMSMADSAVLKPLDVITGGGVSLAIMGVNAGTSAAKEATLRGASKEQAFLIAQAAGGAEAVFEKRSLDYFWDIAKNQGKAATRSAFLNVLAQAGIEGSEEVFTDLANAFTDRLINGGLSEWYQNMDAYYKQGMSMSEAQKAATADFRNQLVDSFLGGALSGGVFGTAGAVNTYLTGKRSTMSAEDYQQTAEGIDTDRSSYMSQEDYDTAMGIQRLAQALSQKENVTDYERGLFEQESSLLANIKWNDSSDNNQQEQIRQIAETMPNKTVANAFVANYKESMPVDTYKRAFKMFYEAGYTEMSFEQALKTSDAFEAVIGKPTLYAIHSLGMNQAVEASKAFTSTEQKELANTMAKALGVTVQYQDIPGANGMYKDGTIYISNSTINPSMVVMSHELTHHLKTAVSEEYAAYENYVIDYFKEYHAGEYDALYNAMAEEYGNDEALIREEIAANAAETFLTDADAVNRFVTQNRSIAEKIADFLNDFIAKLKKLYQGYKAQGKAGKMLAEDIEVYEKARDLWYEAINALDGDSQNKDMNKQNYSIKCNANGQFFVEIDTDMDRFIGKNAKECASEAKQLIKEKFVGKVLGEKEGESVSINNKSAKEYAYASKNNNKVTSKAKMKASAELDNLLNISAYLNHSDEVGKHVDAVRGFDYYKTIFKVHDNVFEGVINVKNTENERIFYDVTKIRQLSENEFPTENSSLASITELPRPIIYQQEQDSNQKLSLKEYDLWDKKNPRVKFHVSDVSEPLISVGIDENREITFDSKKIIKIKADHPEMTDEVIKNVDKIIKEPIAIMNSASVAGRITLVGELEGKNGVPVMIALELNPANVKGIEIDEIKICSAYTRNNFANWMRTQDYLWINPDKNKTDTWLKRTRVQFPVGINQYGLIKMITQNEQNSNPKFSLKAYTDELGLRFSDKEGSDLVESVLQDDVSESYSATTELVEESARILQDGMAAAGNLKEFNVTRDMAQTLAVQYLKKYNATFDKNTLTDNLFNIFAYIQKKEDVNYQDMIRLMQEVCKPVIATSQKIDKEMMKQYNDFRKTVKSYHIRLSKAQRQEVEAVYGKFDAFKAANQNRYGYTDYGYYLSEVWEKLVDASQNALSYSTPVNEQMLALHDYMTSLEKAAVTPAGAIDNSQSAYDMALNIYTDYFSVANKENKQLVKDIKSQMNRKLDKYRKEAEKSYRQQVARQREIIELEKQAEIDRLQKTMQQMLNNEFDAMDNEMAIYTSEVLNPEITALKKKIKAIRQSNTQKIADLKAKNYQSYLNRSLAGKKTAHRNHIKKNMLDLQNRLAKPKEHKYIPRGLVRATIELCEAVNIDTGKSEGLAEHLADMSRLYAKMKDDKDYAVSSEYDPNTQGMIERLQYIFQGRNITTLELEELQEVDELVSQLRFQIVNAGKLIGMEKSKEVYETAVKCMDEIKAAKSYNPASGVSRGLNKYNTMMLNPKRQFRRMSGYKDDSVLNQIYEDLNNGQQKQMQVLMETARIFDPVTKEKHNQQSISKLVGKEKKDWIDIGLNYKNMEPVMVPRAFRVSLAMHIQNKANLDHIIYGGLTIPEPNAYRRGDYATAYAAGTMVQFIPETADTPEKRQQAYYDAVNKLKAVVAQMTPYERAMVKCSEQFFHEYTGEKINEVSLQLNGYKKARVDKYFPIRTDPNFRPTEIEGLVRNGALEHSGMLESRTGARNPILLEDITRVIQRQSENVAKYYGLAIPIRNFNKIYNTTKTGYRDSTKSVIARKWGVEGQKYIENLITDLQTKRGREHTILDTLQGNFAQSVLSDNLSVAAQQIVAYPTAAATLGHAAVIKGIQYIPTKLDMEHIAKYTPLLWYRNQGIGTQEIGDVNKSKDIMSALASKATNVLEQHNMNALAKLTTGAENTINWTMELLQRIDTKAVGSLWKASEIYVRDTKKLSPEMGEDAFYREVAKVFNECVDDTQANYSTMQRPDILRNPNEGVKMLFLFKTQPLQNFAIMYDAYGNLRAKAEARKNSAHLDAEGKAAVEQAYKKAVNDFANAISSQLAAASLVFAMKLFANAFTHRMDKYRNDEDDISGWKMIEELANEVASNMAGSVIGGSEVYELIHSAITGDNYYGISVGIIDSLNDFTESLLRFKKEMTVENLKQLYFDSEILTGVPGENIYKIFNGLLLHAEDIKNGEFLSFNAGHETKLSVQYTAMMNALVDGNTDRYEERYAETLESLLLTKTEKEAKTAIKTGIKEKLKKSYQEADIAYDDVIAILEKLDDKEPYFTVKKWENDEDKEYNKYSELEAAVLSGHGIDEEIKELIDNGVREENVNTKLTSILREGYVHGDISEERVSQYLKQYKTDYTDDDVYWKLREWDKAPSYEEGEKYSKYDDLLGAVESGSFETVVKEYVEHGSDAQSIKQQISEEYRPLYQEAYLNGRHKEVNAIKELLNKLKVNGKRLYGQDDYLGWNKQAKKEEKEKKKEKNK